MADKSIDQLNAVEKVYASDLFVLQQSGTAKKLTGQVLENWLLSFADGHGGIQSIQKVSTSGLADTYRITLADTTTFDFVVTNGKSISSIVKTSTSGLVDTYTITFNDGSTKNYTVTNGAKGDKGDNAYVWIKYASQEPTESSHSMGDIPDNWIGIYSGNAATAPYDWKQYKWYKVKGEKGDTGNAATLVSSSVSYQAGDNGTIVPSGTWSASVPVVAQGKYLWTRIVQTFNTGDPVTAYSISRMGIDGLGSVVSVCNQSPDPNGNVSLSAVNVGALPTTGGDLTGELRMNGQPISGLNAPTEDTQAANKGYVDAAVRKATPRNLLDNSDFQNPVNQRGISGDYQYFSNAYTIDRWILDNRTGGRAGIKLSETGVVISNSGDHSEFDQYVIADTEKKYTLAVGTGDGVKILSGVPSANPESQFLKMKASSQGYLKCYIFIPSSEMTLYWAALYEGEYTAETLPEYQSKGYGVELAECMRYYQIRSANDVPAVDMRPTMRLSSPTITEVTGGYAYSADL